MKPLVPLVLLAPVFLSSLTVAHEFSAPTPEELVARERIRPSAEAIIAALNDMSNPDPPTKRFHDSIDGLVALGKPVGAFMAAELDLPTARTFNIAAYVMGLVNPPGGVEALRKSLDVADRESGAFGAARKQWAAYGLALTGDASVVDLVLGGKTPVASYEFLEGRRLLEVVAVLTVPESTKRLEALLETLPDDPARAEDLRLVVMALGGCGDRASAPRIAPLLKHANPQVRLEAARALGRLADPASVDALFGVVNDVDADLATAAARSIHEIKPAPGRLKDVLALLETIQDPDTRGWLYRIAVQLGGDTVLEALRVHARRPDRLDRTLLAEALADTRSKKSLNLLRALLTDKDENVAIAAVDSLASIGGEGATDTLLALINDRRWPVLLTTIDVLSDRKEARAGPRVADRLLTDLLHEPIVDLSLRTPVRKLSDALVTLEFTPPEADLRAAASRQTDPEIVAQLKRSADQLSALAAKGRDVAAWAAALAAPDPKLRALAATRLGEIKGDAAARALTSRFDVADPADRAGILLALAENGSPEGAGLFERVLTSAQFDAPEHASPERDAAAWGARRLGGARMAAALRRSAERREGSDWSVLLYLTQVSGRDALPVLERVRALRLRHYAWYRGEEQDHLEDLLRELTLGRSVTPLDVPPWDLHEH